MWSGSTCWTLRRSLSRSGSPTTGGPSEGEGSRGCGRASSTRLRRCSCTDKNTRPTSESKGGSSSNASRVWAATRSTPRSTTTANRKASGSRATKPGGRVSFSTRLCVGPAFACATCSPRGNSSSASWTASNTSRESRQRARTPFRGASRRPVARWSGATGPW